MPENAKFTDMIVSAYQHLYDLVWLRTDPLAQLLIREPDLKQKERGWRLHQLLLNAVEDLNPGSGAPVFSRAWRRYRLMSLRYVEGLDPKAVADQLAISLRQYYREHAEALKVVSDLLWSRYRANKTLAVSYDIETSDTHLEMLRIEAARAAQSNLYADLKEVVQEGVSLLEEIFVQNHIEVHLTAPVSCPVVPVERSLLRQMLLAMMGFLIERAPYTHLHITLEVSEQEIHLSLYLEATNEVAVLTNDVDKQLLILEEFASLINAQLKLVHRDQSITGFEVKLSLKQKKQTILLIDDNQDMLALYERYLLPHQYNIISTSSSRQGYELAHQYQPTVIILDLMMAEVDGWDLLQKLLNEPKTASIPIIICSVLKQKNLALSLGASAFLEKPITEEILLSTLHNLK